MAKHPGKKNSNMETPGQEHLSPEQVTRLRSLYEDFKQDQGLGTSGFCPECDINGNKTELFINQGDVFECPQCRLLLSLATPGRATILRRRGNGNFKPRVPAHGASRHILHVLLSREDPDHHYDSDGSLIRDGGELVAYLSEIVGKDPYV